DLPRYERKDLAGVSDPSERPDAATYDKFIFLLDLMKKNNYDHKSMYKDYPLKVKGVGFTSILYGANKYLLKIAQVISAGTEQIEDWQDRIKSNFYKNFCPNQGKDPLCYSYDMMVKKFVMKQAAASMIPLYAGLLSEKQAEAFVELLGNARFCGTSCHVESVPSTALDSEKFSSKTYWRGPVWVNTNWLVYYGLVKYGYRQKAEQIKNGIIELVSEHGFREYFNPQTGEGYGGKDFSWTAALLIDMINDKGIGIPPN
ncbi:MAG: trehalase family glycosidase, partial [Nitrososphaerales archaeon]